MERHDPRVLVEAHQLNELMIRFAELMPMGQDTRRQVETLLREHREDCASRGIDFPELVPIILKQQRVIDIVRKDLTREALQTVIINLTVKAPGVRADELAEAFLEAFPQYRKTNFMIHHSERYKRAS